MHDIIAPLPLPHILFFVICAGGFLFFVFLTHNKKNNSSFQLLLTTLPCPAFIANSRGKIIWENDACKKNNSNLLDEMLEKKIAKHHSQAKQLPSKFNEKLRLTISGQRRLVDLYHIKFHRGEICLAVDINETQEISQRLENIIAAHGQTLNELNTAIATFDNYQRLTFHNRAFDELWQLTNQDLVENLTNAALLDLLRAQDKLAEQENWQKWRENILAVYQGTDTYEDLWHLPNGKTLRVVASPQNQGGVTWAFEDISEELKLESRYNILAQVQGETLDQLKEGVVVFGSDGKLKLFNPAFLQLWNLPNEFAKPDAPINKIAEHCKRLTLETDIWQSLVLAITSASIKRKIISGKLTTNNKQRLDYILQPLPNGQNLLIFADVTSEQLKNDFLQHISTEFRRPLTNILGFAEFLQMGVTSTKQKEYIADIISSAKKLSTIFDTGILQLTKTEIDIVTPIENAIAKLQQQLQAKQIKLNRNLNSFILFADETQLEKIFFNLLANAIKFSPINAAINLTTENNNEHIIFTISDEGDGVAKNKQAMLFADSNSSATSGLGFGLTLVKFLIELHGGKIELDTTTKQGATFKCYFPKGTQNE